jgi:hypothetical protein
MSKYLAGMMKRYSFPRVLGAEGRKGDKELGKLLLLRVE